MLRSRALDVCRYLLPGGSFHGSEYLIGDIHGSPGDSLSINTNTGVWADFAGGDDAKGDMLDLWAAVHNVKLGDAAKAAGTWLGIGDAPVRLPPAARSAMPAQAPAEARAEAPVDPDSDAIRARMRERPDIKWEYKHAGGDVFVTTYRWNALPARGLPKIVRPWDGKTWAMPEGERPILYLAEVLSEVGPVVVCEGEKTADALRDAGFTATTNAGGSNAIRRADWTPLRGKDVVIWPDNDGAGKKYAETLVDILRDVGAASARVVKIPAGKVAKWDAADATDDERRELVNEALSKRPVFAGKKLISLSEWTAEAYRGPIADRTWLIKDILPLGVPAVLAAEGDTGKGMILLDLALTIAAEPLGNLNFGPEQFALGGQVVQHGTVVVFSAEDDRDEIHRRLNGMDPHGERRNRCGERLKIIPLPNAGGPPTLFVPGEGRAGAQPTEAWEHICDELDKLKDQGHQIKLISFDPLASFVAADINADPQAAAFIMGSFAQLATSLGASVLVTHHVTKGEEKVKADRDSSLASMRRRVRGSSAIVDGVRLVYVLWKCENAEQSHLVFAQLGETFREDAVVFGGVVKSNAPARRTKVTFVRHHKSGLLVDRTADILVKRDPEDETIAALVTEIRLASEDGQPFPIGSLNRSSGDKQNRRDEMAKKFQDMPPREVERLLVKAVARGQIVKFAAVRNGKPSHYDVPGGTFLQDDGRKMRTGARTNVPKEEGDGE